MSQMINIEVPATGALRHFRLPAGLRARLTELLDRQDDGQRLTAAEKREAEGLVEMAELLSLLKLRATRPAK